MNRERLFYITNNIDSLEQITQDLKEAGVGYNEYHVLSKDEDGIARRNLHSASFVDRYDLIHSGERGLLIGLLAGLVFAFGLVIIQPFDISIGWVGFLSAIAMFSCFGAWVGGMVGLSTENYKIVDFHQDIENGKYLLMVDTTKEREQLVTELMAQKHPEAELGGIDDTITNPFEGVAHLKRAA